MKIMQERSPGGIVLLRNPKLTLHSTDSSVCRLWLGSLSTAAVLLWPCIQTNEHLIGANYFSDSVKPKWLHDLMFWL